MAVTPTDNRAFLREVDEGVRRERLAGIWSRYGVAIALGVVAVLAALGLGLWWRAHREAARGAEGERLQAAFDQLGAGDTKGADAALAPLARDAGPGYRALARMAQADIALHDKDARRAAALFGAVVADDAVAPPLRDLALVRQTSAEFDTLKPDVVVARLRALAVKGNAYFGSAGEMVAVAYLRTNRRDLAASLFGQIAADDAVPATLRQRSAQMAGALGAGAFGAGGQPSASSAAPPAPPIRGRAAAAPQQQDKPAT